MDTNILSSEDGGSMTKKRSYAIIISYLCITYGCRILEVISDDNERKLVQPRLKTIIR